MEEEMKFNIMDKIKQRWKEMSTTRKSVAVGCVIVMMGMLALACINVDTWFVTYENVTFSTGCVESYKNGELIGEECTYERELMRKQSGTPDFNFQILNLTIDE